MMNTSLGYHTFAFFQKVELEDFSELTSDFIKYADSSRDVKRFPLEDENGNIKGWKYVYNHNKGIQWFLLSSHAKNGFMIQGVMVIINPKALIEGRYIEAAQEDDIKTVEKIYNDEAAKISHILLRFGSCSLNRIDPCLNIDLKEVGIPCSPEQMMYLIKQGNIPRHYTERKKDYDEVKHRRTTDKDSFYLESSSVVINYYWKYPKQDRKHPNYANREKSRDVIRFEVQCKYPKLYVLSKDIRQQSRYCLDPEGKTLDEMYDTICEKIKNPSTPVDVIIRDPFLEKIAQRYFYDIIRKGDYLTLDGARDIVGSYDFKAKKEERMINALELVKECRGIAKARSKLSGKKLLDFERSLKDLDRILVNPVTIPRRWGIKHIPNPLCAYYDLIYEEQLVCSGEYYARRRIEDILSGRRSSY